jgi:hypothetical protein
MDDISQKDEKPIDELKKCFIVTPIGSDNDPIRRHIDGVLDEGIKPVLEDDYNYEVEVSHRMSSIGSINKQILESIYFSDLVIANLTNLNPNVMYELAFRHSTGKPVITIAEQGTSIPFDVIDSRTIFYINDPTGMRKLRSDLKEFIENNDLCSDEFGPIIDTFKGIGYKRQIGQLLEQSSSSSDIADLLNKTISRIDDKLDMVINQRMHYNQQTQEYSNDDIIQFEERLALFHSQLLDFKSNPEVYIGSDFLRELKDLNLSIRRSQIPVEKKKEMVSRTISMRDELRSIIEKKRSVDNVNG